MHRMWDDDEDEDVRDGAESDDELDEHSDGEGEENSDV